ncbi:MAG TPA: methyltransferase domain-containing protein [Armatimonadota bacterium]|nr:methyltransferase domain-containing protein [Armatimonadota bacterium]
MTSQVSVPDYRHFVNRLADELVANGAVVSAPVEAAFRKVPRHLFIDRAKAWFDEGKEWRGVVCDHQHPDPQVLDRIYRNDVIQISDSATSSEPGCMAWMLEDLGLRPRMKVLEVGTGSGYNAALLAEIVGDPSLVYSVEVDEQLARSAKRHLEEAGYHDATVVTGDGAKGYVPGAPYDAIIVTCGCNDLAPAWVEQVTKDGTVLFPLHFAPAGDPTLLVRRTEGELRGHFTRLIYFVNCTSELLPPPTLPRIMDMAEALALSPEQAQLGFRLPVSVEGRDHGYSFVMFMLANLTPDEHLVAHHGMATGIADTAARQACALTAEHALTAVGGRQVLERFRAIARRWEELGCPRLQEYAITVRAAGMATDGESRVGVFTRRYHDYLLTLDEVAPTDEGQV